MNLDDFKDYSPGPWAVTDRGMQWGGSLGIGPENNSGCHYCHTTRGAGGINPEGNYNEEESWSNARLIAAAPNLLAECRRLTEENGRLREALEPFNLGDYWWARMEMGK